MIQGQLPDWIPHHPYDKKFHRQRPVRDRTTGTIMTCLETRFYGVVLMISAGESVGDFMEPLYMSLPAEPTCSSDNRLGKLYNDSAQSAVDTVAKYSVRLIRAIAAAELDGIQFMHCDLNHGNVCILPNTASTDHKVTIIDFGFSRVQLEDGTILSRDNSDLDTGAAHDATDIVGHGTAAWEAFTPRVISAWINWYQKAIFEALSDPISHMADSAIFSKQALRPFN